MTRLTDRQRLGRAVDFLTGLSHPEVRKALRQRGLTREELEDGFQRLRAAIETFHAGAEDDTPADVVPLLDAWENSWLPIIRAALEHRFPAVAKTVLLNITQQRGLQLFGTLPPLLDRVEALEASKLAAAREAHALLVGRGVTASVIAEARALLRSVQSLPPPSARKPPVSRGTELDALWAWYLEWSKITRATITDRALLRVLGFGKVGRPKA